MIDFAFKLKSLRELRGWSQEELAKRLGVSRSKIGNYEQGTREPGFEDLEAFADIFNVPIGYLVDDAPVIPPQILKYAEIIMNLSPESQEEAMNFVDFLENKKKEDKK